MTTTTKTSAKALRTRENFSAEQKSTRSSSKTTSVVQERLSQSSHRKPSKAFIAAAPLASSTEIEEEPRPLSRKEKRKKRKRKAKRQAQTSRTSLSAVRQPDLAPAVAGATTLSTTPILSDSQAPSPCEAVPSPEAKQKTIPAKEIAKASNIARDCFIALTMLGSLVALGGASLLYFPSIVSTIVAGIPALQAVGATKIVVVAKMLTIGGVSVSILSAIGRLYTQMMINKKN